MSRLNASVMLATQIFKKFARLLTILIVGYQRVYDKQNHHYADRHKQRLRKIYEPCRDKQKQDYFLPVEMQFQFHAAKIMLFWQIKKGTDKYLYPFII